MCCCACDSENCLHVKASRNQSLARFARARVCTFKQTIPLHVRTHARSSRGQIESANIYQTDSAYFICLQRTFYTYYNVADHAVRAKPRTTHTASSTSYAHINRRAGSVRANKKKHTHISSVRDTHTELNFMRSSRVPVEIVRGVVACGGWMWMVGRSAVVL